MKYLIWLVIVFAGIWWLRQQRQASSNDAHKKANKTTRSADGQQVMVPCAHCGAHVPEADAIQGTQGVYCSEAHRQRQEG